MAVRGLVRSLWEAGYRRPVQLGVRSRMTDKLLNQGTLTGLRIGPDTGAASGWLARPAWPPCRPGGRPASRGAGVRPREGATRMSTTTTYDDVLASARRLPLPERLRLASVLTSEAAGTLVGVSAPGTAADAGWTRWARLRAELSARPTGTTSMTVQLERDRDERQAALEGDDVHP